MRQKLTSAFPLQDWQVLTEAQRKHLWAPYLWAVVIMARLLHGSSISQGIAPRSDSRQLHMPLLFYVNA